MLFLLSNYLLKGKKLFQSLQGMFDQIAMKLKTSFSTDGRLQLLPRDIAWQSLKRRLSDTGNRMISRFS